MAFIVYSRRQCTTEADNPKHYAGEFLNTLPDFSGVCARTRVNVRRFPVPEIGTKKDPRPSQTHGSCRLETPDHNERSLCYDFTG
jgi:hypothetical protein